jgi:hypothetical protein
MVLRKLTGAASAGQEPQRSLTSRQEPGDMLEITRASFPARQAAIC